MKSTLEPKSTPIPPDKTKYQKSSTGEVGPCISTPKKLILPKTPNQTSYIKAIDDYDIVICIGPAGTGKTYLAVAKAVSALMAGKVSRIILTRPAVEAGESLGFLPGNLKEKVDPYLRPLYDALYDMIPMEKLRRLYDEEILSRLHHWLLCAEERFPMLMLF